MVVAVMLVMRLEINVAHRRRLRGIVILGLQIKGFCVSHNIVFTTKCPLDGGEAIKDAFWDGSRAYPRNCHTSPDQV